jgi:YegS/Rv2252/BmrU family lipid kinase
VFLLKEFFFIINPTAAGGRVEKTWNNRIKPLLDSQIDYDFEFTTRVGHALEISETKAKQGYKVISAVGGDGTANETINGILKANSSSIFSAFTVGTGNDIPTTFGIPEGDIEAIVDSLINGQDKKFDVGYCEKADRYFGGIASMGFDAEVANRSNKFKKRLRGTGNYQVALITTILKFKPYDIVIESESSEPLVASRMLLAIGNGKRYGGGMHVCPGAEPDDGKFYCMTLKKISRISLLRLFPLTYDGEHLSHPAVETFEGSKFKIDCPSKPCLYQVDGEILGYLPETIVTKPNFLTVRVPDPWKSYSEIWAQKLAEKKK